MITVVQSDTLIQMNEAPQPQASTSWEGNPPNTGPDVHVETSDKVIKKVLYFQYYFYMCGIFQVYL